MDIFDDLLNIALLGAVLGIGALGFFGVLGFYLFLMED